MVRALSCPDRGREFESLLLRQAPSSNGRTQDSQTCNTGSVPVGATSQSSLIGKQVAPSSNLSVGSSGYNSTRYNLAFRTVYPKITFDIYSNLPVNTLTKYFIFKMI